MRAKDAKTHECPKCGAPVARLGGSWRNNTFRIEFCINSGCNWTRKLYRIYPEHKESDWKECLSPF